jgi:hypothetical protein
MALRTIVGWLAALILGAHAGVVVSGRDQADQRGRGPRGRQRPRRGVRARDRALGEGDVRDGRPWVRKTLAEQPRTSSSSPTSRSTTSFKQGAVTGPRTDIARAGVGVGVREGAPSRHLHAGCVQADDPGAKSLVYMDPAQGRRAAFTSRVCCSASALPTRSRARAYSGATIRGGSGAEGPGRSRRAPDQRDPSGPGVTLVGPSPATYQKDHDLLRRPRSKSTARTRRGRSSPI